MTLIQHLEANGISFAEFGRRVGARMQREVSARTIERYAKGQRTPRGEYMVAIVAECDGAVAADSFFAVMA